MSKITLASAQINTTVGDIDSNTKKIINFIKKAEEKKVDILAFPELTITGYPPEDLVHYDHFVNSNIKKLKEISKSVKNTTVVIGFVNKIKNRLYNSAAIIENKKIKYIYNKIHLPNYGVFDEKRYFYPGEEIPILEINNTKIGISICEDIWEKESPVSIQARQGAQIIININSSPFEYDKYRKRVNLIKKISKENNVYVLYTNQVGGQDELVFDGGSLLTNNMGEIISSSKRFDENLMIVTFDTKNESNKQKKEKENLPIKKIKLNNHINHNQPTLTIAPNYSQIDSIYRALVLGTKDYIKKNNFSRVLVAVSGGIDSALVTAIAVNAIGPKNVMGVSLPSKYSSDNSYNDAKILCENLGMELIKIPINNIHSSFEASLEKLFNKSEPGLAEENIQSRIRGNIMMAIANKFNFLLLSTGNKSEMATGYGTLYGDMAGAFSCIKDVSKTMVYEICEYINRTNLSEIIPKNIIIKPPTAELRPNQLDSDSLPPYDQLDLIIKLYVEKKFSPDKIAKEFKKKFGFQNKKLIMENINLIDRNEYKRRQSPPGVKISNLALGKDRRLPISSGWKNL
ncbi:MAG: NAD+ synthase [Dehalococcoidia bacterium]|nr:NAD+ synthase [Dehalococcoidia bacterium]|tara:strand:+ start:8135 stop:9850 length:1716 start_codon:yes stop_codon:yes gene_type:complete